MTAARECGVAFCAQSCGGMFGIYFRHAPPASYAEVMDCDKEKFNQFFHAMVAAGVYFAPSAYEAGFVSAAHTDADIGCTTEKARAAFASLR
jgi:glutamate-1-semialdehyde 2,1-aminomutase